MIQPDSTVDLSLQSKNRPGALIIAQLELKLDLNQGIRCQDPKEWKQGPLLFSWYSDEMHWRFKRVSRFPPNLSKAQRLITDIAPDTLDKSPAKRRWGCIRTRKVWTPSCSEPLGLLFVEATQNQYSNTVLDIYSQGNIVSIDRIGHVGLWYLVIYYIYTDMLYDCRVFRFFPILKHCLDTQNNGLTVEGGIQNVAKQQVIIFRVRVELWGCTGLCKAECSRKLVIPRLSFLDAVAIK